MSEAEKRPFAVFDIDGTLIRWQLYHAIADRLAKTGHISQELHHKFSEERMVWKRREHEESFHAYETALVRSYQAALAGLTKKAFLEAVHSVFEEYKDQTYTYTRDLIRHLKSRDYLLFAISGSQAEIIEILAEYYKFDDFGGSVYEYKGGKFTGKEFVLRSAEKPRYLAKLIEKHNATYEGSIGIGDSGSDIPILEAVQHPIAFNPDKKLFSHAKEQGWKAIVERKNVIYELEPDDGTYKLVA